MQLIKMTLLAASADRTSLQLLQFRKFSYFELTVNWDSQFRVGTLSH